MRVKATQNGLALDEPNVTAKINGKVATKPKPLSQVIEDYGHWVDFDQLRSLGWQDVVTTAKNGERNTITFSFI